MTETWYTADAINDDALEQLYERLRKAEERVTTYQAAWHSARRRARWWAMRTEATVARVRRIHNRGSRTNMCNDCGQPWPCEVTRALEQLPAPAATEMTRPGFADEDGWHACTCTYGNRCSNCRD